MAGDQYWQHAHSSDPATRPSKALVPLPARQHDALLVIAVYRLTSHPTAWPYAAFTTPVLHEGGYTIERASSSEQLINEQFEQQRHTAVASLFDFEKELRNNRESFNTIRHLSPTRYRFRVKNAQGIDIRTLPALRVDKDSLGADSKDASSSPYSYKILHSARAECSEPGTALYEYGFVDDRPIMITKLLVPDCKTNVLCVYK